MLQIKNISKTYKTGNLIQKALDNVSLNLRDNEFVAILGPSGSGKTTLLNIIGGLDKYDSGDLVINNISTKHYKDKDWDSYRNHTIGFVFQSYNLIPHQSILSNVELALTISGINGKDKKQMALDALDKVGLKEQAHKKPNQLSGGQMQRVAIARALVNNPSIVLADEPTGALDTKTSIQVMDLLKEVAKDRLVVMVTHNPELAEEYANRIVKLKDGNIIDDSNPYVVNDVLEAKKQKIGKAHMSFLTALSLSFNNLLSKKGRTILTAFAGSIGIIGIALILSLSTGFQNYIDKIQDDTMSSYPLTIQSETSNIFGAILSSTMPSSNNDENSDGLVHEQMTVSSMVDSIGSNDLKSFMEYLENNKNLYENDVYKIKYSYSVTPRIYTKDITDTIVQTNPSTLMSSIYSDSAASLLSSVSASSSMGVFQEYDLDALKESTTLLEGDYPSNYNEVMIVLNQKDQISDLLVYSLGLRDNEVLKQIISDVITNKGSDYSDEGKSYTYADLMNRELKLVDVSDLYKYNSKYDTFEDMSKDEDYMENVYNNAETLKITGVAVSDADSSISGVIYLPSLVDHVIDKASNSAIVRKQLDNPEIDVFSGNRFDEDKNESGLNFNDLVTVDEDKLKNAFKFNLDTSAIENVDYPSIIVNNSEAIKESIPTLTNSFVQLMNPVYKSMASMLISLYNTSATIYYPTSCGKGEFADPSNPTKGCKFAEDAVLDEDYFIVPKTDIKLVKDNYITYVSFPEYNPLDSETKMDDAFLNNIYSVDSVSNVINETISKISEGSQGMLNMSVDNLKKVVNQMFKSYFETVRNNEATDNGLITLENLNKIDVDAIENTVLEDKNIASMIYSEAYDNAKIIVTAYVGKAVQDTASPFAKVFSNMENAFSVDTNAFSSAFNFNMDEEELSRLMSSMLTSSSASYSNNLTNLGYQKKDEPTTISFYFNSFDSKENFLNVIDNYNNSVDETKEISYTDMTGILMSSVSTIINAVTYVLIAFVSISLIVSSIMIAVITLISVMERTKEIGILRAMGASKRNVSSIFNAETFIIGLLSGTIGVGVSYLLTIPINKIIYALTEIEDIKAVLKLKPALILVGISVFLTMIAGFIPSKKAAKQDPVIALRSE